MTFQYGFHCPLPNGLHARPASHFQEVTNRFRSEITLVNERNGNRADAKSMLSLVAASVKLDDPCQVFFSGEDAAEACRVITAFVQNDLPKCDEPLPAVTVEAGQVVLPRSLQKAGLSSYQTGIALCRGMGRGRVVLAGGLKLPPALQNENAQNPAVEQEKMDAAITSVGSEIEKRIAACHNPDEATVLRAHRDIVKDPALLANLSENIRAGHTAGQATVAAGEHFSATLLQTESLYLRERVLDIQDICQQLLRAIYGSAMADNGIELTEPSVCVAETLTPGQFLSMDRNQLKALVLGHAGSTSHTVILARSFGIPTLAGVKDAAVLFRAGQDVIVDANLGLVIEEISTPVERFYQREFESEARLRAKFQSFQNQEARTADGRRMEVAANIASAEEGTAAFQMGAEGIGLFRTEMLFMDREVPPSEEEQYTIYATVIRAAQGKPVIIRTLDIGGDKPVPYLKLPEEANPFLGYRGVRLYPEFAPLFKSQLRAVLRAAAHGPVKMMVPMISSVEEVIQVKAWLAEAREELREQHRPEPVSFQLGVMLEVPSAAFLVPDLGREVDFFSIGTNDLTQYFLAADRDNAKVAGLYHTLHPAFLRLLKKVTDDAHAAGRWIGLCGEMGENAEQLPLLVGLGVDEISLATPRIARLKAAIAAADANRCRALVEQVVACTTRKEVSTFLENFRQEASSAPALTPELIVLDSDARDKEEAIRELAQTVHLSGRTENPNRLEEEIWQREAAYSTGFGSGFAIPHCKSENLGTNTIALLRSRHGIEWKSLDGQPVRVAILLAMRGQDASKEHLKMLSQLSRRVMREEFQQKLMTETDPVALSQYILENIQPAPAK